MKGPRGLGSNPASPLPSSVTSDGPLDVPKSEGGNYRISQDQGRGRHIL